MIIPFLLTVDLGPWSPVLPWRSCCASQALPPRCRLSLEQHTAVLGNNVRVWPLRSHTATRVLVRRAQRERAGPGWGPAVGRHPQGDDGCRRCKRRVDPSQPDQLEMWGVGGAGHDAADDHRRLHDRVHQPKQGNSTGSSAVKVASQRGTRPLASQCWHIARNHPLLEAGGRRRQPNRVVVQQWHNNGTTMAPPQRGGSTTPATHAGGIWRDTVRPHQNWGQRETLTTDGPGELRHGFFLQGGGVQTLIVGAPSICRRGGLF